MIESNEENYSLRIYDLKGIIIQNSNQSNNGGLNLSDYTPINTGLIKNKGITIPIKPDMPSGILSTLILKTDMLGNDLEAVPSLGAILPLN